MSPESERSERPQITARWTKGKQFALACRSHLVTCDQPVPKGGTDEGPTPTELLAGSVAACVGVYVLPFFERRGIAADGLEVIAHWEGTNNPARVGLYEVQVILPEAARGKLSEQEQDILLRAAEACYVHRTLAHAPEIVVRIGD